MNTAILSTAFSLSGRTKARCLLLACLLLIGLPGTALSSAGNSPLPLYPIIENNVRFWKDIYTKYSHTTAVIHDKNDLSVVYETVATLDGQLPGADKVNKMLLDGKKNHYIALLRKLSRTAPGTAEERRVAALFSPPNRSAKMGRAADSIRVQTGLRERFLEGVIRSGAYLPAIKRIFRSYNLPEDLAYLPHVESSFDIKAYSKLGASGVWQFTQSTGRQYLRIDAAVDERSDPILAAHAAAKYLKNSYSLLGSWPLALTSYNYGTGGMQRALREKGSYERIFSEYNKGHFKFASRNFYSEFLAALAAAKEWEGNPAVRLDRPRPTRAVTLKNKATIQEAKRHFGVTSETLQRLNPALKPAVFNGQRHIPRGYALNLPSTAERSAPEPIVAATRTVHREAGKGTVHKVKKGDTISGLSRRYHITPVALTTANNLHKGGIRIGQTLHIPPAASASTSSTVQIAARDKKRAGHASQRSAGRYGVFQSVVREGKHYGRIQVQPGETLKMLAEWAGLTATALRRINRLKEEAVHPGRKLVILFDKVSAGEFQKKRLSFHQGTEKNYLSSYSAADPRN